MEDKTHKLLWDFDIQSDYLISARQLVLVIINKNRGLCRLDGPLNKIKESEMRDEYLDLDREKKMEHRSDGDTYSIGALGTMHWRLAKVFEDLEIRWQVEIIQTIELLRSVRILRRVWETWGDLLLLKLQWKTIG